MNLIHPCDMFGADTPLQQYPVPIHVFREITGMVRKIECVVGWQAFAAMPIGKESADGHRRFADVRV